jgi:hypothetical protein
LTFSLDENGRQAIDQLGMTKLNWKTPTHNNGYN